MNEAIRMQISAFVDGELPDNESELLLRRLSQDAELRQQVAQYLEIGRVMRNDHESPGIDRLRGRIAAALGEELAPEVEEQQVVGSRFMTPASGIAVAATVAALALLGLSQLDGQVDADLREAVAIDLPVIYTEPTPEQVLAEQPSELLMEYYRRHGDSSPDLGSNGILSRMVTFELREEHVETEPDPHLVPADEEAGPDESAQEN